MGDRQWFILYVVVCLEVGIFLTLVPWSAIWERNYFLEAYPSLRAILLAPGTRGAIAGLGLANIYMGLSEVVHRRRMAPMARSFVSENSRVTSSRESRNADDPRGGDRGEAIAATDERR